jgi:hypothetical protein
MSSPERGGYVPPEAEISEGAQGEKTQEEELSGELTAEEQAELSEIEKALKARELQITGERRRAGFEVNGVGDKTLFSDPEWNGLWRRRKDLLDRAMDRREAREMGVR